MSPSTRLTIDGVELAVHDSEPNGSTKPVLLCLHAIGHGGGDFTTIERALTPQWRVISFDWPGQGYSALGLEQFVLLGNSIGGPGGVVTAHP